MPEGRIYPSSGDLSEVLSGIVEMRHITIFKSICQSKIAPSSIVYSMIPWFSLFVEFHKDFLPIFVFMNGLAHFMKYLVFSFPLFFKPFVF